ncbi:MAG: GNAT family N-acetyltransferase [Myxococcota bacterium]
MTLKETDRTRLRRNAARARFDRTALNAIVDEALIAFVGVSTSNGPCVLPMAIGRIGTSLYLHGAIGNGLLRNALAGRDICATIAHVDGMVMAKSALHHSMNYRSAVVFGPPREVVGEEKARALDAIVNHALPGRSSELRATTDAEARSTRVLALELAESSVKVRSGGPSEASEDASLAIWNGVLPVRLRAEAPISASEVQAPASTLRLLASSAPKLASATLNGGVELCGDPSRLDFATVYRWLKTDSYWSDDLNWERFLERIPRSFWVGAIREGELVGVARALSDGNSFGWLCDVYVVPSTRGKGIGGGLVDHMLASFPWMRRWMLGTASAHAFYARRGFERVTSERLMVRRPTRT